MKLIKFICLVALIFYLQIIFAQVSNVEGIKPLEGVAIPKVQPTKDIKPGISFKDCNECPEMVMIPAGSFMMGSPPNPAPDTFRNEKPIKIGENAEKPQHPVQIQSFAIGKYEVTQEEWYAVMGNNPSANKGRRLPVESISWTDAQDFIKRLSQKTGKNYRLPTEAEWEYAARAGSTSLYPWGNSQSELPNYAWFNKNSSNSTNPVGLKKPNQFGIYDMLGNVWEWTQDCWNDDYKVAPSDGSAWTSEKCWKMVVRGGSWNDFPLLVRPAYRDGSAAVERSGGDGFRVARTN